MKWAGPNRLLILQDIFGHAYERVEKASLVPDIFLLDDRWAGLYFPCGTLCIILLAGRCLTEGNRCQDQQKRKTLITEPAAISLPVVTGE